MVGTQKKTNLIQAHGENAYFLRSSHPPFKYILWKLLWKRTYFNSTFYRNTRERCMLHGVGLRYKRKVEVLQERRGRQRRVVSDVNILELRTKFKLQPVKTANMDEICCEY